MMKTVPVGRPVSLVNPETSGVWALPPGEFRFVCQNGFPHIGMNTEQFGLFLPGDGSIICAPFIWDGFQGLVITLFPVKKLSS